jgi:hypothetical protein
MCIARTRREMEIQQIKMCGKTAEAVLRGNS